MNKLPEKSDEEAMKSCYVKIERLPIVNLIPKIKPDLEIVSDILKSEHETDYNGEKLSEKRGKATKTGSYVKIEQSPILNLIPKIKPDLEIVSDILKSEYETDYNGEKLSKKSGKEITRGCCNKIEHSPNLNLIRKFKPDLESVSDNIIKAEYETDHYSDKLSEKSSRETTRGCYVKTDHSPTLNLISKIKPDLESGFDIIKSDFNQPDDIVNDVSQSNDMKPNTSNDCNEASINDFSGMRVKEEFSTIISLVSKIKSCTQEESSFDCSNQRKSESVESDLSSKTNLKLNLSNKLTLTPEVNTTEVCVKNELSPIVLVPLMKSEVMRKSGQEKSECAITNSTGRDQNKGKHLVKGDFKSQGNMLLTCNYCGKNFSEKYLITNHIARHMDERLFQCILCVKRFNCDADLKLHAKTHNSKENSSNPKYTCDICNKVVRYKRSIKRHLSLHEEATPFHCKLCHSKFKTMYQFRKHALNHKRKNCPETGKQFCCDLCGKLFSSKDTIKSHFLAHANEKLFECHLCRKRFNFKCNLKQHLDTHLPTPVDPKYTCSICNKSLKNSNSLKNHILITHDDKRPYHCSHCSYKSKKKSGLKVHKAIHENKRLFQCSLCPKRFNTKSSLNRHKKTHKFKNSDISDHVCSTCKKHFKSKKSLKRHMKIHDQNWYSCLHCDYKTKNQQFLKTHIISHNDSRPYQCSLCPSSFKIKERLMQHLDTHNNERRFECTLCPKRFNKKSQLKKHIETHSSERKYVCEHCGASFKTKDSYLQHKKRYFKKLSRALNCKICGEKFHVRAQLETHLTNHTDEEKKKVILHYICDCCGKKYSEKRGLRKHIKLKHSE